MGETLPHLGLQYDLTDRLDALSFTVSEVRVEKVRHTLADPIFDPGARKIDMREMAFVVNQLQHVASVNRAVHSAYVSLHRMLRTRVYGQRAVAPPGTPLKVETDWVMCEQAVEFLRIQLRDPLLWRTNMLTSFNSVISVCQKLAIPSERENVVVVGSDIAKHLLAVFNYTAKECGVLVWTKEVVDAVTVTLGETGVSAELLRDMIISVQELSPACS